MQGDVVHIRASLENLHRPRLLQIGKTTDLLPHRELDIFVLEQRSPECRQATHTSSTRPLFSLMKAKLNHSFSRREKPPIHPGISDFDQASLMKTNCSIFGKANSNLR
jgi:hypothetical protein